MRREVPEPWASAMLAQGFEYARRPSMRALARAAGIPSVETVRQIVYGESTPEVDTVEALAGALRLPRALVGNWVGHGRISEQTFEVPPEASLLTPEEQEAVRNLIRAIARPRKRAVQLAAGSGKTDAMIRELAARDAEDDDVQIAAYHSPEPAGQPAPEQP